MTSTEGGASTTGVQASTVIASLVLNAGVSIDELALASGVPVAALRTPTMLSYDVGMRLWAAAEQLTGDPYVGLHCGERMSTDQVSLVGTAFAHSPDLRAGLVRLAELMPLLIRGTEIAFVDRDGDGALRYASPRDLRHGVDAMFAGIVRMARDCTQHRVVPRGVELQASAPPSTAPYLALFGVEPRWERPICELVFSARDLDRSLRGAAPAVSALLAERARALLAAPARPSAAGEVERAMEQCLAAGDASASSVARRLGWSPRTLQRRLHAEGDTLSSVRDRVLARRARALLAHDTRTIEEIAQQLGFATRSSFERAYRRWTGSSPARDRRA